MKRSSRMSLKPSKNDTKVQHHEISLILLTVGNLKSIAWGSLKNEKKNSLSPITFLIYNPHT
jgi:hypothetical protein